MGLPRLTSLAPDGVVGVLLGLAHLGREVGLELGQGRLVDGDAGALHARQDLDERQLEVAQQLGAAGLVEPLVEHGGELEHGAGPHHRVAGRGVVVGREVEHPLVAGGLLGLELAAEVAHHEVLEVEGALVGAHQVGRQRGVAGDAGQGQPAGGQRLELLLGVVQHLGGVGVGQPAGEGVLLLAGQRGEVEVGGRCRRHPPARRHRHRRCRRGSGRTTTTPCGSRAPDGAVAEAAPPGRRR